MARYTRRQTLRSGTAAVVGITIAGCADDTEPDANVNVVSDPDGDPVDEITLLSIAQGDAPARYEYGQLFADNLRDIGFQVEYDPQPTAEYLEARAEPPYPWDIQVRRAGDGFEPAEAIFRGFFHSSNIGPGNSNLYAYDNPEVDDLIDEQAREMDPERRTEIIHEIQEHLREDLPIVPLLVQERIMPYNQSRFQNPVSILEQGLGSFWNYLEIEPTGDDAHLRTTMAEDINSMNPLDQTARGDREMLRLVYDRLARVSADTLEPEPWAASEIDVVDDTTIEISLRQDMTFHDGEDVTAEDVRFSFEYAAEHSPTKATRTEPIESIDVETDLDLVFNLKDPNAPFLANTLARMFIIPQHIWENVPENVNAETPIDWQNPEAIGSGPFQVESAEFAEQIQLSAYDDHFHPPNIDRLTRAVVADVRAGIRAYESGDIDMMSWELPIDDLERFEQDEDTGLESALMMSIHHMGYNLREPPFDDVGVRRAVAHAVPQETIIDTIYGGTGQIIHNPMSPGFEEWYWNDVDEYESSVDVAMQQLDDLGFQWNEEMELHYPPDY